MTLKGRHWVMLWLVVALGTLGSVAARQSAGFATARALRDARDERAGLEARRGEFERRIRQASSRQVLIPRAAADLGLHEPAAGEITVLVMPTGASGGLPPELFSAPLSPPPPAPRAPARTRTRRP